MPETQDHDEEFADALYHLITNASSLVTAPQSVAELCALVNTDRHQLADLALKKSNRQADAPAARFRIEERRRISAILPTSIWYAAA